jgi:nucleoside-diphosphate-sugar epimerase
MRLLVLGGTVFLGRAIARQAAAEGHDVTCAARGKSGEPVNGVRFVTVDRDGPDGLAALGDQEFDALVDVARRPSHARGAVTALRDRVGHAVYVSSCSAYQKVAEPGLRVDNTPLLEPLPADADEAEITTDAEMYGRGKVTSELVYRDGFGADRVFVCRAGLIVGPEDELGRFEYWVRRIAAGGEVLAPGRPGDVMQQVDVRDLADWLIRVAEQRVAGTFDGTGPPMPWVEFLTGVAAGVGAAATFTWVSQEFLLAQGVAPWSGDRSLPIWLPLPEYGGFLSRDVSPSMAAGLRPRPIADTARDTWTWLSAGAPPPAERPGLERDDETALLHGWHRSSL